MTSKAAMNNTLLEEATRIIENKQVLVNAVSKRVRQLSAGSRPLILVEPRMDYADIAFSEIIAGKLRIDKEPAKAGSA
jgi:DNA-directed RNA polymerase subunit omega